MLAFSRPAGRFDAVIKALCADRRTYFGDPDAVVQPMNRIEQAFSSILRLRVETAAGRSHVYVKILKARKPGPEELAELRQLLANEYAAMRRLHLALAPRPGLAAVRPIAVFPELLAVVMDEVVGERLDRVIWRARVGAGSPAAAIGAARMVGAWVRGYQEVTPPHGKVSAGREYLDVRLRALCGLVLTEEDRDRALSRYDALNALIAPASPLAAIHGDLCPANILVQPGRGVTVLDFTTAKTGSRLHDIAHLYLHLEFQRLRVAIRGQVLRSVQDALMEGFEPGLSPRHPEFKLMLLQHLACHLALLAQRVRGGGWPGTRHFLRRRWLRFFPLCAPATARD